MVNPFRVEECGELWEDVQCWYSGTTGIDIVDDRSGRVRTSDVGSGENGQIGIVGSDDDVMDGEEGHAASGGCTRA